MATTIKVYNIARVLYKLEKTQCKLGSAKYIQKNRVIYKKLAVGQIAECIEEKLEYRPLSKIQLFSRKSIWPIKSRGN